MAFITSKCTYGGPLWIWFHNLAPIAIFAVDHHQMFQLWRILPIMQAPTDWLNIEEARSTTEFVAKIYQHWFFFSTATVANLSQFSHQCNWLINLGWGAIYFPWNKKNNKKFKILGQFLGRSTKLDINGSDMNVDSNLRHLISRNHFQRVKIHSH